MVVSGGSGGGGGGSGCAVPPPPPLDPPRDLPSPGSQKQKHDLYRGRNMLQNASFEALDCKIVQVVCEFLDPPHVVYQASVYCVLVVLFAQFSLL